jgi:hypothetical protein
MRELPTQPGSDGASSSRGAPWRIYAAWPQDLIKLLSRGQRNGLGCSSPRKARFALRRQRNLSTRGRSEGFRCADIDKTPD